jgi:hypothetical protein
MTMKVQGSVKQIILELLKSLLFLVCVFCMMAIGTKIFIFFLDMRHFSNWTLFDPPPSKVEKIIRVDGNKVIWVQTQNGEIYSKLFYGYSRSRDLSWHKGESEAHISYTELYSEQAGSCKFVNAYDFEKTNLEPPEKIVQCARLEEWRGNSDYIWYFALSENGKLWTSKYWSEDVLNVLGLFCTNVIAISLGVLLFIMVNNKFLQRKLAEYV